MYYYPHYKEFYDPRYIYMHPPYHLPRQRVRELKISGNIHIKDYETFGSDEHCNLPINLSVPLRNREYATVFTENLGCGGECRTEVEIQAKVLPSGDILVNVFSRFYEGSSEVTTELEDHKETYHFLVRPDTLTPLVHNLANNDVGGSDTSQVALRFENTTSIQSLGGANI
ncbi:hypothetical protein [Bacillus atrophaeus]|uniref:hypothetical protein n=1 Tax=Bacillus atrophaeus TaxID=1452 RepID=UPI00228275A0|nr:hypothetical protein [Bacillus atrophaeus]MCY9204338.1 hypothetical protein [Bacillus atrophaeus]MEC0885280.1 hypothetical protein [Bacillus atrophaeus]